MGRSLFVNPLQLERAEDWQKIADLARIADLLEKRAWDFCRAPVWKKCTARRVTLSGLRGLSDKLDELTPPDIFAASPGSFEALSHRRPDPPFFETKGRGHRVAITGMVAIGYSGLSGPPAPFVANRMGWR